ncbi:ras guanine nucleotide exchange factor domain-containing protein [Phascolomyces articulosus]|uniref:Ras guanine nucleotide exchange factor domain-containing protein n=1 Tax=Phascolomyces articulosus TaxID=60185 RepID=A0AAD5K8Q0_9FUNG|nr:ras guanine nucleotide exchange factor domain-containing protein [Phascolomyces articulosus]
MSSMPKILCTVRALHPFHSPEQSSLSFERGDFIDVLAQLESGWWDGWCNGARGWFPSNYVEMINVNPELADSVMPTAGGGASGRRARKGSVDSRLERKPFDQNQRLPDVPEIKQEDDNATTITTATVTTATSGGGTGHYFYDPVTGSVQYHNNGSITGDSEDDDHFVDARGAASGDRKLSRASIESSLHGNTIVNNNSSNTIATTATVVPSTANNHRDIEDEEKMDASHIMSQWVERVTPQGRIYFCNLVTQETTWDKEEIDKTTGRLHKNGNESDSEDDQDTPRKTSRDGESLIINGNQSISTAATDQSEPLTWQKLSGDVALAIHQLNVTAQQNLREHFIEHTGIVVETIRLMLYAAGLIEKDSHHTQDQMLRNPHRAVMAALSKLVLSARIASDMPATPPSSPPNAPNNNNNNNTNNSAAQETVFKLQKDAGDVLAAVRNFVTACQQRQIRVEHMTPRFVKEDDNSSTTTATAATTSGGGSSFQVPGDPADEPDGIDDDKVATASVISGHTSHTRASNNSTGNNVPISAPTLPTSPNANVNKPKYRLNQDLIVSLQTHANQIYGSTEALAAGTAHAIEIQHENELDGGNNSIIQQDNQEKARESIVMLFRTLSEQISQYLAILEGISFDQDQIQAPAISRFKYERQRLFTAFGQLFNAIQVLSDPSVTLSSGITAIDETNAEIEETLERILSCVQHMVGQRRLWLSRRGTSDTKDSLTNDNASSINPISPALSDPWSPPPPQGMPPPTPQDLDYDSDTLETVISSTSSNLLPRARSNRHHQRQISPNIAASLRIPGNETPPQRQRQASTKPSEISSTEAHWFLGHEYAADEIVLGSDGNVKGGTVSALVERLTLHDTLDTSFIANFLLTYRSFCTTEEFVNLLEKRYTITAPEGLTPQELEIWTERKQKLIRLRVFNVMKNWLENYYNDEDEFILDRLEFFTSTVIRDASGFSADQLKRLILKRREIDADDGLKKLVPNNMAGPTPILPKNVTSQMTLLDTDPLELARQLSIMDFKLYSSIRPIECLNKAWSRDDQELAFHVKQSIDYCNRLTAWVTGSILEHDAAKQRVVIIKHWTIVADKCRILNNYNTCMAIFSAFDNSAVGRLRRTWEIVGNRTQQTLNYIRKLMGANRNFTEYREMIHSVNPPCIPFLGIYLQDLTFIEDGNPDCLAKSADLINFAKRQKTAEVIREIKQFQSSPYTLQVVPSMQEFIKRSLEASLDVEALYERSLELEPRTTTAAAEAARLLEMIN